MWLTVRTRVDEERHVFLKDVSSMIPLERFEKVA